jgi:hypothetical protein
MRLIARRTFASAALALPAALVARRAHATVFRGLRLPDLVAQSEHVLLLTGLDARCLSIQIAGRRSIVTESRVRVDDVVARAAPGSGELLVRTLGGELDGVGELVHGQAEFVRNQPCLAFLTRAPDGNLWVTGMAQGHYPVASDSVVPYLLASPHLSMLEDFEHSAVRALVRQKLSDARRLVLEASRR